MIEQSIKSNSFQLSTPMIIAMNEFILLISIYLDWYLDVSFMIKKEVFFRYYINVYSITLVEASAYP